jgi:hypothetical protein
MGYNQATAYTSLHVHSSFSLLMYDVDGQQLPVSSFGMLQIVPVRNLDP